MKNIKKILRERELKAKRSFKQYLIETTQDDRYLVELSRVLTQYLTDRHSYIMGKYEKLDKVIHMGMLKVGVIKTILNRYSPSAVRKILANLPPEIGEIKLYIKDLTRDNAGAMYDPKFNLIILDDDLFESGKYGRIDVENIRTLMVHELRHGLDFIKSNKLYPVGYHSSRSRDAVVDDEHKEYQSSPSEINARYAQAIEEIDRQIERPFWTDKVYDTKSIYSLVTNKFKKFEISYLFPEKTESKQYKRLITRAVDYIQNKLEH